jgi:RNA polymerase sigma-70 factor (ECF subfamily)
MEGSASVADLSRLVEGDKRAWDRFVADNAAVIYAAVRRKLASAGRAGDADDVVQDVFVKLCRNDFKILKSFDPKRSKLTTFLTVVATTTAIDHLRKARPESGGLDEMPERLASVDAVEPARIKIPDGLLPERQALVIKLLYTQEMEVSEAAELLGVEPQTVRSLHHKALTRLRAHFGKELDWEDKSG